MTYEEAKQKLVERTKVLHCRLCRRAIVLGGGPGEICVCPCTKGLYVYLNAISIPGNKGAWMFFTLKEYRLLNR